MFGSSGLSLQTLLKDGLLVHTEVYIFDDPVVFFLMKSFHFSEQTKTIMMGPGQGHFELGRCMCVGGGCPKALYNPTRWLHLTIAIEGDCKI